MPVKANSGDAAALTLGERLGVVLTTIDVTVEAPEEMSAVRAILTKRLAKRPGQDSCQVGRMESRLIRVECTRSRSRDFIDYVCDWSDGQAHLIPVHGMTAIPGAKWSTMSTGAAKESHYRVLTALTT